MKIGYAARPVARRRGRHVAIAVVGLAMLATSGCGSDGDTQAQDDGTPLKLWVRAGEESVKDYKALAAEFTKKTGVKVDVFGTVTDFDQRLNAAASAKQLPDVITTDNSAINSLVQRKLVTKVDKDSVKGGGDISDRAWKSAQTSDGTTYAVPFSAQSFQLLIRSDWRQKVGAQVPKTWAEMVDLAKKFTTGDPDGNGKADTYGMTIPASTKSGYASWFWSTYLWQAGGDFVQETGDGKAKPVVNSPEAAQSLTEMKSWFCTHKVVQPGAVNTVTVDAHKSFESGQTGMYFTGPYNFERFDKNLGKAKYEVVDPPAGPKSDTTLAEGTSMYFMAGSKKAEQAKQLAEFMITPDIQKTAMTQPGAGSIVRLPVNKNVDITEVLKDQRWTDNLRLYSEKGKYLPNVAGWGALRQSSAETVNKVVANCGSDPKAELDTLNQKFGETLKKNDALAG
jgi:multiple sugar transport system substrate-binding protein